MLTFLLLVVCIIATVVTDYFGEPPNYLVGLLGTAAGAFFAAIGSDQQKKAADLAQTATEASTSAARAETTAKRAEHKIDEVLHERLDDDDASTKDGAGT